MRTRGEKKRTKTLLQNNYKVGYTIEKEMLKLLITNCGFNRNELYLQIAPGIFLTHPNYNIKCSLDYLFLDYLFFAHKDEVFINNDIKRIKIKWKLFPEKRRLNYQKLRETEHLKEKLAQFASIQNCCQVKQKRTQQNRKKRCQNEFQ